MCTYFTSFLQVNLTNFNLVTKLSKFYILSYKLLPIIFNVVIDFGLKEMYLNSYLVITKNIFLKKKSNVRLV